MFNFSRLMAPLGLEDFQTKFEQTYEDNEKSPILVGCGSLSMIVSLQIFFVVHQPKRFYPETHGIFLCIGNYSLWFVNTVFMMQRWYKWSSRFRRPTSVSCEGDTMFIANVGKLIMIVHIAYSCS